MEPWLPGSLDDVTLQHWGMLAGCMVFGATLAAVLLLLVCGGSFQRMAQEAGVFQEDGKEGLKEHLQARPILYSELLAAAASLPLQPVLPEASLPGDRLKIAALTEASVEDVYNASNGYPTTLGSAYDAERLWRFLPMGPFNSLAEFREGAMATCPKDGLRCVIVHRELGRPIGMVSLLRNRPRDLRVEIGDMWLHPSFRGQLLATEAVALLLEHLFELGYRRVEWITDAQDAKSMAFAENLGFLHEGTLRKHRICGQTNRDEAVFSVLNNEWRDALQAQFRKILQLTAKPEKAKASK